jgi:hypothetical protein
MYNELSKNMTGQTIRQKSCGHEINRAQHRLDKHLPAQKVDKSMDITPENSPCLIYIFNKSPHPDISVWHL